jgi:hypothetical protein
VRTGVLAALLIAMSAGCSSDDHGDSERPSGAGSAAGASPLGGGGAGGASASSTGGGGAGRVSAGSGGAGGTSGAGSSGGAGGTSSGGAGGARSGSGGAGSMTSGGAGGMSAGSGGAGGKHEMDPIDDQMCVVAQRLDACCPTWVAVEHGEARTQPCLVEIGEPQPSQQERAQCAPQVCTNVLCPAENEPPTRVAFKGDGMCMLGDECFGPGECTIAYDATACCPCPESLPKSIVELEPCLVPEGMSAPETCPQVACGLCGLCPPVDAPSCPITDALTRCR